MNSIVVEDRRVCIKWLDKETRLQENRIKVDSILVTTVHVNLKLVSYNMVQLRCKGESDLVTLSNDLLTLV